MRLICERNCSSYLELICSRKALSFKCNSSVHSRKCPSYLLLICSQKELPSRLAYSLGYWDTNSQERSIFGRKESHHTYMIFSFEMFHSRRGARNGNIPKSMHRVSFSSKCSDRSRNKKVLVGIRCSVWHFIRESEASTILDYGANYGKTTMRLMKQKSKHPIMEM